MYKFVFLVGVCLASQSVVAMQSDPCAPSEISAIELSSGSPVFLASSASVGLVAQANGEIMIYDLSNGRLDRVGEIVRPVVSEIVFYNDVAFVMYENDTQLEVIDFSVPANANVLGTLDYPSGVFDIVLDGSKLFAALGAGGMEILDVTDPANLQVVGSITNEDINHVSASSGKLMAAVLGENDQRTNVVYDVTDPASVTVFADNVPGGFLVNNVVVNEFSKGRVIYGLDGAKLSVDWPGKNGTYYESTRAGDVLWHGVETTNDQSPVSSNLRARRFNTDAYPYSTSVGYWSLGIQENGLIVGPSDAGALVANTSNLWLINIDEGVIDRQPLGGGAVMNGDDLIVTWASGVRKYDLSDPENPVLADAFEWVNQEFKAGEVFLSDGLFFVQGVYQNGWNFPSGLIVYDAQTLEDVFSSGGFNGNSSFASHRRRIAVGGDWGSGYYEIDDENEVVLLGDTSAVDFSYRTAMHGDLLVSLSYSGDLAVYDLSDPDAITEIGELQSATSSNKNVVMISQGAAVVTDSSAIKFIDLSDPTNPVQIDQIDYVGGGRPYISFSDGLLGVSRFVDDVNEYLVYDVTNVQDIRLVEEFQIDGAGGPNGLTIHGSKRVISGRTVRVFESCFAPCDADFTGDGVIDFFDVDVFLEALVNNDSSADLTGEGVFDFFDVSVFLQAFAAGCP